jgi:hypothetical protein
VSPQLHEGRIITIRPKLRWTSDSFEVGCWNGEVLRVTTANRLTLRYARMALTTRFRSRLRESLSYGLALEGISAAHVAADQARKGTIE